MAEKEDRIFEPAMFRDYLKVKMISLLNSVAGKKLLMLESDVRQIIGRIVSEQTLSEHGVADRVILPFEPLLLPPIYDQIMIFLKPTPQNLIVLKQLIDLNKGKGSKKFYPCFWPKRNIICKQFFDKNSLNQFVDIRDFSFDLLPLDVDVYSLEMQTLKEVYIKHNHSIYSTVAESIHRLQCIFGKIHNIYGKGKAANTIYEVLKLKQNQIKMDQNYGNIESVIIIDRAVDFLTPLLKQQIYEGMVDELYNTTGRVLKIPISKFGQSNSNDIRAQLKQISLDSERDHIYESIRGLQLKENKATLRQWSVKHKQFQYEVDRMREVVQRRACIKKLNAQKQYLEKHLKLVMILQEDIKSIRFSKEHYLQQSCLLNKGTDLVEYFENCIPFDFPLENILKNMAIESIINKGIHRKIYSRVCEDICLTYGMQHIVSLTNLANTGIFHEAGSIRDPFLFSQLKKELKLLSIDEKDIDDSNPLNVSYSYGGYVPIVARLVQHAIRDGWSTIQKALKMLPGQTIMPQSNKVCKSHPLPAVVVYFVGGVTYGEIAAIRSLGKILKREVIVATTEIINGESMIRQLLE